MVTSGNNNPELPILPGRLSDPENTLGTDPRVDPRLLAAATPFELHNAPAPVPVNADSSYEDNLAFGAEFEVALEGLYGAMYADIPLLETVERRTEVIKGVDGNDITLYIHKPVNASGPLPCVYHTHGGAMVILEAANRYYTRWRDGLADLGMVVVGAEFRNGAGKHGNYPFPAGLNDCMSGLQWTHDNRSNLGISKIIVSGESGGGNLALAVTLKAKKDGKLDQIQGTYSMCPYIFGQYAAEPTAFPSLYENDDLILNIDLLAALARIYDPDGSNTENPVCWPYSATDEDLQGLPPHVISVNELDPLRDEGIAYYRKLMAAGVDTYSRTVNGTFHAGDMWLGAAPDVYAATLREIKGFADSL